MSFSCVLGYLITITQHLLFGQFQKVNSAKFVCRIVHRSSSEGREDGFRGPSGRASGDYMLW
jgi:hypothetical protein